MHSDSSRPGDADLDAAAADPNFLRTVVLLAEYGKAGRVRAGREPADGRTGARGRCSPSRAIDIRKDVHLFTGGPVEPIAPGC